MFRFYLILLCSLLWFHLSAQNGPCGNGIGTILFSEDFDGEANQATTGIDASGTSWSVVCPACSPGQSTGDHLWVENGGLEGQDTNGPATFTVSGIDLTDCAVVSFTFDYTSIGYMGSGNLECVAECQFGPGCSGNTDDVISNTACNNCWDFLYGELDFGSSQQTQVLLGDDCNVPDNGSAANTVCASTDSNGDPIPPADLASTDINIVMAMWAGAENMTIDNVVLICYTAAEVAACADATVSSACPAPMCDAAIAAATPSIVVDSESTCLIAGGTPDGGMISAATCPAGSTIEYAVDGGAFTTILPEYDQSIAQSIVARCVCDIDDTMIGTGTAVVTNPATCPPLCEPNAGTINNNK